MPKKPSKTRLPLTRPEPKVLRLIREESRLKGTNTLSSRRIEQAIKATGAQKSAHGRRSD